MQLRWSSGVKRLECELRWSRIKEDRLRRHGTDAGAILLDIEQHVKIGNFDVFHVEFIISTFIFYKIIPVTGCFLLIWSILLESTRSGGTKCFFKFEFGVTEDKLIDVSKYCFYCNISR